MSYLLGWRIKENLMDGRPTRCKSEGDYTGEPIPPCGEYAASTSILVSLPRPPWMPKAPIPASQPRLSLHEEIVSFMEYMNPTAREIAIRKDLVKRFTNLIASFRMNASVRPVGSYVTGLYLPTSDIDMVLTFETGTRSTYGYLTDSYSKSDLYSILSKIRSSGFASDVVDVLSASVPLIRITDRITGIEIDLTAADTHGVKATETVQNWLKTDTELVKALITVVKIFLTIRKCGTTYTGGVNSYVLVWMVVAWVRLEWPKMKKNVVEDDTLSSLTAALDNLSVTGSRVNVPDSLYSTSSIRRPVDAEVPRPDLGHALKGFLKFYGQDFDYFTQTIKIEPKPAYTPKTYPYSRYPTTQCYLLSIFDPADASIDMGLKAYAIKHIQASFKEAYNMLVRLEKKEGLTIYTVDGRDTGMLGKALGGDFTKFVEKRRRLARV